MKHLDIDTITFKEHLENDAYVLLDVRTPEEFSDGHLKNAANINFHNDTFEEEIDELDKRKKYLVYCRSGNRSRQAMFLMRDLGFEEVYNLERGIIDWKQNNFPIE